MATQAQKELFKLLMKQEAVDFTQDKTIKLTVENSTQEKRNVT